MIAIRIETDSLGKVEVPSDKLWGAQTQRSLMLVTALSPIVGYDKASQVAHYALDHDLTLKEAALKLGCISADQVPAELLKQGLIYPLQSNILETEIKTAVRVAKLVFDSGLARVDRPADIEAFIRQHVYKPDYKKLV